MLQHFSAHGLSLGSREIPNFFLHGLNGPEVQRSYALFCNRCGNVWAKIEAGEGSTNWWIERAKCRDCGGGEIATRRPDLYWHLLQFADDWPAEAVEWEFNRLLEQALKGVKS